MASGSTGSTLRCRFSEYGARERTVPAFCRAIQFPTTETETARAPAFNYDSEFRRCRPPGKGEGHASARMAHPLQRRHYQRCQHDYPNIIIIIIVVVVVVVVFQGYDRADDNGDNYNLPAEIKRNHPASPAPPTKW